MLPVPVSDHTAAVCATRSASFLVLMWSAVWLAVPFAATARGAEFYVGRDRWHSGIIVERAAIPAGAWPPCVAERDFAGCRSLELGWGDRTYYIAPHPTVLIAIRAALIPGPSVLHIAGFAGPPQGAYPWTELVRVTCSAEEFAALCRALGASFVRDARGSAQPLGRGLYGLKSQFYAARGRYWIGNTCNTWTLREARAGGLPTRVGPAGTLTSGAVTAQVRRLVAGHAR